MAVFRIDKTRDYTVMANFHLRDISLSLKAKGLLSLMLSLPENWDYTTKGLAQICKDGVDSICATLKELEKAGYIQRRRVRNEMGRLTDLEYTILEKPIVPAPAEESPDPKQIAQAEPQPDFPEQASPHLEKPQRENPVVVNPVLVSPDVDSPNQVSPHLASPELENPAQLNTNTSSKEKINTDLSNTHTCSSENPQKVTLTAGQSASVSFHNVLKTGSVKLVKKTNTGENLAGWQIGLYYDTDCTQPIDGSPFVTGADGTITVSDLEPGTLYAKEIPTDDPYWEFDTEVKEVTIAVNQTATVTFTNTHYGRIEFRKTTNTGNHLGGWTFRVQDSNYDVVGEYTTDENGYACTENLPLGRYTVIELQTDDLYWNFELGFHDVTVKAGETVVDEWLNREQGLGWFHKKTNTGESVEGWHITIYADEACTQEIRTMITNEDGRTGYYMDPGIYWAKETGDEYGRFEDEYWMVDETVQKFEIKPHENTEIIFTNVQYGKVKILKTMEGEGSIAGWQFKITDAEGKEIEGSPFTSDENGEILTTVLPGKYTIEELIPKDSLYHCTSENPQTVTIAQGQTAEVTFTNALRPGKITLDKVDIKGNSLAGATFLLEWSEDGSLWWPIEYSDSETVEEGCCSNPNVVDGLLTTGSDGKLEWDNLHPGMQYRLTETKAPQGYTMLKKAAFEGELPEEDFSLEVKVINSRTFTLPVTGSCSLMLSSISMSGCLLGLIASMLYLRKKEQ